MSIELQKFQGGSSTMARAGVIGVIGTVGSILGLAALLAVTLSRDTHWIPPVPHF